MTFDVIPQNLSISAMRSSGYKDTAHAIAELVDNSIQSGLENFGSSTVELICVDKVPEGGKRTRLSKIGVFDDAAGMDAETLRRALQFGNGTHLTKNKQKGIGKFGMGLPNSSISQCKRVDVWSWQDGKVLHCYLDVAAIERGEMTFVPEPVADTLPADWLNMIASKVQPHGTLVVWSYLDRVSWKQSKTLLQHAEFIIGRVYRKFISISEAKIRLASYEEASEGALKPGYNSQVRPNDPLYLMAPSSSPAPYNDKSAFELFTEPFEVEVGFRGEEYSVKFTASICQPEVRIGGGDKPIGQHARKNLGISVVRAGRELELNRAFENNYDPRERWWGIEVEFEPALDDVFGVTNNKQSATGFVPRYLKEDAAAEGLTPEQYQNLLEIDEDPRMPMYIISAEIDKLLRKLRKTIRQMKEVEKAEKDSQIIGSPAEIAATESVARRRALRGNTGLSDKQEGDPTEVRTNAISAQLQHDGIDKAIAEQIAVQYVSKSLKYRFRHADLGGTSFFEVDATGGLIMITLNTAHPVHSQLFSGLPEEGEAASATDDPRLQQLLLLLAAWGRMEDEANAIKMKSLMIELRQNWGSIALDFFEEVEE
ncbi:ATP-binding protein [Agrobacterium tumefaciens]|uniref:ATP-binding protein n=1 Tax=Agrobacterium tumefaciens TaxID=358 RepID=UPI003BA1E082